MYWACPFGLYACSAVLQTQYISSYASQLLADCISLCLCTSMPKLENSSNGGASWITRTLLWCGGFAAGSISKWYAGLRVNHFIHGLPAPRISGEIFSKAVLSLSSDIYRGPHKLRAAILGNNNTGQTLQSCRAAGRISRQLLLILHEANAVTAAIRLSQTLKMCSDIKGNHSTFGRCSCCSWKMRTYLFLLQTGQSHSWPDSTLYSRQFLHTRTLQPLQHGHRVNIVPSAANG